MKERIVLSCNISDSIHNYNIFLGNLIKNKIKLNGVVYKIRNKEISKENLSQLKNIEFNPNEVECYTINQFINTFPNHIFKKYMFNKFVGKINETENFI